MLAFLSLSLVQMILWFILNWNIINFVLFVTEKALYISLDNPSDLTMLIFPSRVSFLLFQELRIFSKSSSFFSKLRVSHLLLSLEKWIPKAQTEFSGQRNSKGVSFLVAQHPSHMASVFDLFSSMPEQPLNFSNVSSDVCTDSRSLRRRVLSSAYKIFFSVFYIVS